MEGTLTACFRPFWGVVLLIAGLCGLHVSPSHAIAIYESSARARLTITDIAGGTGLLCTSCTDAFGDVFHSGNATGSSTGAATVTGDPANLASGDRMDLFTDTKGSASAIGSVDGFFVSIGDLEFSNTGTTSITVTLRLRWQLNALASVGSTANEDAIADAEILVVTGSSVDPIVDTNIVSDVLGILGPTGGQSAADDFTFTLEIAAGEDDFINITLISGGFADAFAAAPEPGILPLIALGLAGLGFFARRRKHA